MIGLVRLTSRHAHAVLLATVLVVACSAVLASRLRLETELAALLPSSDPSVETLHRVQERLGSMAYLQIAIESPDKAANLALADRIARALANEHDLVDRVAYHVHEERAFVERTWWLYLDARDLELIRERLERELRWRKNPLLVDITSDEDESLDEIEARLRERARSFEHFPDGYFMSPDGHLVLVMVWPPGSIFGSRAGEAVLERTRAVVDGLGRDPAIRISYIGSVRDAVAERHALQNDLLFASMLCSGLVALVVVLFFGRLRSLPLVAVPAACGVSVALGTAALLFGHLNASTAFLGPIILGNGINSAIVQLARYEEERAAGTELLLAIERSVTHTMRATFIAALAAATAYGSLSVTRFRGFSEFGVIGACGMLVTWLATLIVLPALLVVVDRHRRSSAQRRGVAFGAPFAHLVARAPRTLLVAGAAVTFVALAFVPGYLRDPFEYNFRNLRTPPDPHVRELAARTDAIFGRSLSPIVILADREDQLAELVPAIRARNTLAGYNIVGDVITLRSALPGLPDEQRAKLATLAAIRALVTEAGPTLSEEEASRLARWVPPADLAVVMPGDLPEGILHSFRDARGELAPLVVVSRAREISPWDGHDLLRLAAVVRRVELPTGEVMYSTGNAVIFAGMIEAILRDGPLATIASLLGVLLIVIVLARTLSGAAVVVGSLLLGVLWTLGAAALLDLRVNVLNFIALPITFGIGVDYAINVYLRIRAEPRRVPHVLRETGSAVTLCSMTTVIGYGSLLVADNQALRSFGQLAILGELGCVLTALLVMPAVLVLLQKRRSVGPPGRAA